MTENNLVNRLIAIALAILVLIGMTEGSCVSTYAAAAKKPVKVKLTSVKASGLKIQIKWKKAKNAKKYQVYMKAGTAKWRPVKTVKKTSYVVSGKEGASYQFKVRGINGKKKGSFSAVKKISIPKKEDHSGSGEDEPDGDITITRQPEMEKAYEGDIVTFSVEAEGKNLHYQWYESKIGTNSQGKPVEGASDSTFTVTAALKYHGSCFYCVISNNSSSRKTEAADLVLVLGNHVYVMKQPEDTVVYEGDDAVYEIELVGTGEFLYQWYRNDTDSNEGGEKLEGETSSRLAIDASLTDDDTYYYCKVRDDISANVTEAAKLSVEISPARKQMVKDLRAFINKNGILSTETIEIDGDEYYVLAQEGDKVLVLMKDVWERIEWYRITAFGRWDDDTKAKNTRYALNSTYLKRHKTIKVMAAEVTNLTADNKPAESYYETQDKGFILTEADVMGTVSGCETTVNDFSFDKTESHIGKALPKEIALVHDEEGNVVKWWIRSPLHTENTLFCDNQMVTEDENGDVMLKKLTQDIVCIRPAVWLDLSIE